jgi:hypothetical protein
VTGLYPSISTFKGCAAGKSSGFHILSHGLQLATWCVLIILVTNWPHGKTEPLGHISLNYGWV